jgi:hypothetical protein
MSRPKSRQVGTAGLVTRYRNGMCTHTCRRCHHYGEITGWRAAMRAARSHDAAHRANAVRYNRLSREDRYLAERRDASRRRPLRRLAAAVVVLALAALAFSLTVANVTGHATPAPAPAAPSIAILPTTTLPTTAGPGSEGYVPTPAGPPATNQNGTWIPEPAPAPPAPAGPSAGGSR